MKKKLPIIIGITGYIGSGKSTVLNYFSEYGIDIVDADRIVHELYKPGKDGWRKINDFFGDSYITKKGIVNRKKLGKSVFSNPAKLKILEKLVHPLVYNEINKIIQKSQSAYLALEAVKFENSKLEAPVECLIWIDVEPKVAYKRFSKKRKISYKEFLNILNFQIKPSKIDFIITNNRSKKELKKNVSQLIKKLVN